MIKKISSSGIVYREEAASSVRDSTKGIRSPFSPEPLTFLYLKKTKKKTTAIGYSLILNDLHW